MKTLALALMLPAGQAPAGTVLGDILAECAGRYSATVEHLWLTDGGAADGAARRRDAFADLVAALPDPADALARRVAAKAAQRALLDRALFARDLRAGRVARDHLASCDSLLPGA